MFQFVNVKDQGAKGDGINVDGSIIQGLIDKLSENLGPVALYFPEGRYRIIRPLVVRRNVWLTGQSSSMSVIEAAVSDALLFEAGFLNTRVENLLLRGAGASAGHTGIRLSGSQMNRIHGVEVSGFTLGVDLSNGVTVFSGYNHLSSFQVTACRTGIRAHANANANTLRDGRVLGLNGGDVGIDVMDVAALAIDGVTSEGSDVPLRVRGVVQCSVTSCYFEASNGRPAFDIELSTGEASRSVLVFTGNRVESPGRLVVPPEAFFEGDSPALEGTAPARHPASTAGRNFTRNGDLRLWQSDPLLIPNWAVSGAVAEDTVDSVTSGRSMRIQEQASASCGFRVPDACGWVTAGVRYKRLSSAPPKFGLAVGSESQLIDAPPGPTGVWREDFFSSPTTPGAEGAVTVFANGGGVLVDEVWVVAGRVASASRAYAERVELLEHPRPLVARTGAVANEKWSAPPLEGLLQRPASAVGALLRLSVLCKEPVTAAHYVMFGTTAPGAAPAPKCHAIFAGAESTQDVTARLSEPGEGISGEYHTGDGTSVDYAVWLMGWVVV